MNDIGSNSYKRPRQPGSPRCTSARIEGVEMKALAEFAKTTLIGGLLVILPIYVAFILLAKALGGVLALLSPVTAAIPAGVQFREVIAILIVVTLCLLAGLVVRTKLGLRAVN